MRLERLANDKFKVFITVDDLVDRGLTRDDIWHNAPKVQQLFQDVMKEASSELGFEVEGKLDVEVFALQAQGMIVIVTKDQDIEEIEEDSCIEYVEMQVTLDECLDVLYEFQSFEDIISVSHRLHHLKVNCGSLYSFEDKFYLFIKPEDAENINFDMLIALLAEYGSPSVRTIHRIEEYGKVLISQEAVGEIVKYFHN